MGLVIHYFDIQPFIATLAGMFLARGLCYLISVESIPIRDDDVLRPGLAQDRDLPGGLLHRPRRVADRAGRRSAVAAYVLHRTRFGRTVYAIGGSESSAHADGPARRPAPRSVSTRSAASAPALGGLLFSLYMLSGYSLHAVGMELDAIAAVVIGGTLLTGGRGLVVGLAARRAGARHDPDLISFDGTLSSWWTRIIIGVLLLVFVVVQRFADPAADMTACRSAATRAAGRTPVMADVARLAGVSHQTVSRVINGHDQPAAGHPGARRGGDPPARLPAQHRRPRAGDAGGSATIGVIGTKGGFWGPSTRPPHHPGRRLARPGYFVSSVNLPERHPRGRSPTRSTTCATRASRAS